MIFMLFVLCMLGVCVLCVGVAVVVWIICVYIV